MPQSWWRRLRPGPLARARPAPGRRRRRLEVEQLEERLVPALSVTNLNGGQTPASLVSTLTGGSSNVSVSNINYVGNNVAAGTFTGGNGIIGFDSGVVLSTGAATGIIGPNTTGTFTGAHPPQPGDPALSALADGAPTFDAAELSFDFTSTGTVLSFSYVFGSEAYNQLVKKKFNDVFAFLLDGQNVAVLPGTKTQVSIHNVNLNKNSQLYINNAPPGDPFPATPPLLDTQLDGLTVVLTVVINVQPNVSHHMELAIANAVDHNLDSDVMIEAGSFTVTTVPAFHPLRYISNVTAPPSPSGTATGTYQGTITLQLPEDETNAAPGPLFIYFPNLPAGVTVVSPSGKTGSGVPFIAITPSTTSLSPSNRIIRVPIELNDPQGVFLSTFYLDFTIDLTGLPALQ
jgi:hypothetical protein